MKKETACCPHWFAPNTEKCESERSETARIHRTLVGQINYYGMLKNKKTLQICEMTTMRVPCWYLTLNHKTDLTFWELNSLTLPPVLQGRSGQMTIPISARLPLSIGHLLESECPYHGKSQKNTPRISLMTVIMTTMLAPNPKPQYRLDLGSSIPVRS